MYDFNLCSHLAFLVAERWGNLPISISLEEDLFTRTISIRLRAPDWEDVVRFNREDITETAGSMYTIRRHLIEQIADEVLFTIFTHEDIDDEGDD